MTAEAAVLQPCPTAGLEDKGTPTTAAGWGGSVSGISCEDAGQAISRDFAGAFIEVVSGDTGSYATEDLEAMEPGLFRAGGFDCIYGRHDPARGWPVTCRSGDQIVAFTLSP